MHQVSKGVVAYVRTDAGTVKLHEGDTVPAEADENHVAELVERGVLTEVEKPPTGGSKGRSSGSSDPS